MENNLELEQQQVTQTPNDGMTVYLIGVSLVVGGLFIYAGKQMIDLRSVAGDSVAEHFYQLFGYATCGMGIFLGTILGVMGIKLK